MNLLVANQDIYFLLRYLQPYEKLERGPSKCKERYAQNTIVHVGDYHRITHFLKFFMELVKKIYILNEDSNCITFKQPFDFF